MMISSISFATRHRTISQEYRYNLLPPTGNPPPGSINQKFKHVVMARADKNTQAARIRVCNYNQKPIPQSKEINWSRAQQQSLMSMRSCAVHVTIYSTSGKFQLVLNFTYSYTLLLQPFVLMHSCNGHFITAFKSIELQFSLTISCFIAFFPALICVQCNCYVFPVTCSTTIDQSDADLSSAKSEIRI